MPAMEFFTFAALTVTESAFSDACPPKAGRFSDTTRSAGLMSVSSFLESCLVYCAFCGLVTSRVSGAVNLRDARIRCSEAATPPVVAG